MADLDALWSAALAQGDLTITSRRDERGPFVMARVWHPDGFELICTAATLPAALRGIAAWGHRGYWQMEVLFPDQEWRPIVRYANELAAVAGVREHERLHPSIPCRFVLIESKEKP
jgi:hypothetical protein